MALEGKPGHWNGMVFVDRYGGCWATIIVQSREVGAVYQGKEEIVKKDPKRVARARKAVNARWAKAKGEQT